MSELLLEVGLEEMPARMISAAEAELASRVTDLLHRERLMEAAGKVASYSTPRRLAVRVEGVLAKQPDLREQVAGPSWKIAFPDGQPSAAAQAFAKKVGVPLSALSRVNTAKGEYVAAVVHRAGRDATQVLTELLAKEIASLSWPKAMYWRLHKPERFVRPLRWLLCLLDEAVIPIEFAGLRAGNQSYGHRILHGAAPVTISRPSDYLPTLEAAFVLVDVHLRRQRIRKALDAAVRAIPDVCWREDETLVEQVTHLTEWPAALSGSFESEYLTLPEEVLVTVMRDHQKYFAVEGGDGKLAPHFLAVLNAQADPRGQDIIRHGNERVLRARFNDARFFWNYDQKIPLAERVDRLKSVIFQKDLGSYLVKTEINLGVAKSFAGALAAEGVLCNNAALEQAVHLAKADLTTELVKEFTELQGIVGGLYARFQGLGEAASQAIYWQYLPASADDPIPPTIEGQIFGLADRMATIVEMFAIGLEPSGSKDPFALRRAASGVIKILAESALPLPLSALQELTVQQSARTLDEEKWKVLRKFLEERLEFYLREVRCYAYDVVNAVLSVPLTTVPDAIARAHALTEVRGSDDLVAVSASFKRIKNILRQVNENKYDYDSKIVKEDFVTPSEQRLHAETERLALRVEALRARRQYREALEEIATLRPAVDEFFDQVMVLAPEERLRRNRVALIAAVFHSFSSIADFSEIVAD